MLAFVEKAPEGRTVGVAWIGSLLTIICFICSVLFRALYRILPFLSLPHPFASSFHRFLSAVRTNRTWESCFYKPATQYGQSVWALFGLPQPGHSFIAFTSFNAFPANCLCLFFECDVFFLGTAFNMPSQISARTPGILIAMAGMVMEDDRRVREDHARNTVDNGDAVF